MKASRILISWVFPGIDALLSSNRNQSSTEPKMRISFIVIPLDLAVSICHCTNSNSFFIALMLAFPVLGCCDRALNFVRSTFVIVTLSFSNFSTKNSLRKFLYRSFPSFTKAKMRFAAFSFTSSPDIKLLSFTTSSVAYGFPRSNMNCETLCIASCTSLARLSVSS